MELSQDSRAWSQLASFTIGCVPFKLRNSGFQPIVVHVVGKQDILLEPMSVKEVCMGVGQGLFLQDNDGAMRRICSVNAAMHDTLVDVMASYEAAHRLSA